MKKIFFITLIVMLCVSLSSMAFAVTKIGYAIGSNTPTNNMASTMIGLSLYAPSQGVLVSITTCNNSQSYCGAAQHKSSTPTNNGRQYYTSSGDPAMRDIAAVDNGPTDCTCQ